MATTASQIASSTYLLLDRTELLFAKVEKQDAERNPSPAKLDARSKTTIGSWREYLVYHNLWSGRIRSLDYGFRVTGEVNLGPCGHVPEPKPPRRS